MIPLPPNTSINYFSQQIIGDTVLSNSKRYKILHINRLGSTYNLNERIDTLSCNVFRYVSWVPGRDYMIDSLKAQQGNVSKACRVGYAPSVSIGSLCYEVIPDTVIGKITTTKRFQQMVPLHTDEIHDLSAGLGITFAFDAGLYETYTVHLKYAIIDGIDYGTPILTDVKEIRPVQNKFVLHKNYPNPFNSTTVIPFEVRKSSKVEINIYDINGRKINTLLSTEMNQGSHSISWDGTNQAGQSVASGVYIYTLTASAISNRGESYAESAKLLLLR